MITGRAFPLAQLESLEATGGEGSLRLSAEGSEPQGVWSLGAWAVASPQPAAPQAAVLNYSKTLTALANGTAVPLWPSRFFRVVAISASRPTPAASISSVTLLAIPPGRPRRLPRTTGVNLEPSI